jgi:dihydrofolate reductase
MEHFRKLTLGKPVVMGHNTFLSIGKPLFGRVNIIVSRKEDLYIEGASVCDNIDNALFVGHTFNPCVYVIGGGQIYSKTIALATRLEMTEIDGKYEGDIFFPMYKDTGEWMEESRDAREGYAFVTYVPK